MSSGFWDSVLQFIEKHPVLFALIGAIFGSILTLVGIFFRQIGRLLARLATWLLMKMRGQGEDHTFEQSYLDWLIREHRHLGLLPAQLVARLWRDRQKLADLENVFVRLSMAIQTGDERWTETYGYGENSWRKRPWIGLRFIRYLASRLLPSALLGRIPILIEQTYQPGDLGLVVDRHKQLVIRGDPGSGKTTLLRYLALTCARSLRNNKHDGDSRDIIKKRFLWTQHPFPILVRLQRHGNVASWDDAKELTDTMLQEMPSALRKRCPPGFFERHLQRGNCLILLDAFDELGNPEARVAMARKIAGFLAIYKRDDNRIVVTTRVVGYEGQLDQYDFAVRTVQNLKTGETRALVKQRYSAIALSEIALRPDQESRDIREKMRDRADRLIERIENTPSLTQLATNPMLLSLIVLVHSLKIELPEERLLLYRDCVEILTESWQQFKREEAGIKKEEREELVLNQKLVLLGELAFAMQQQRKDEGSLALMPKDVARDLLAQKLPDLLGGALPQNENARGEACRRKAEEWIAGIQEESGILVEQGLDEAGVPLIGFSHLTFQEYLAAVAIHENKARQSILRQNLLQPAWREIVLLYAALANDATPIIHALLRSSLPSRGVLLAGSCLAERPKKVKAQALQMTLERLKEEFTNADNDTIDDFGKVMGMLGGSEITMFLRQQLSDPSVKKQLVAVKALGRTRTDTPEIKQVRADLLHVIETSHEIKITVAAREALAQIGDPRFTGPEPILVHVPKQPEKAPMLMREWKDLKASPEWKTTKNFILRFNMLVRVFARVFDYWLFTGWHAIRRRQLQGHDFEIGKHPVTNMEYGRFVEATEHPTPRDWKGETFPRKEATHPIVGITRQDAEAYCKWLSHKTGKRYRLPTEWEWEWAAAGPHGWKYPWGNQFDKDRCNTEESGIEGTTPAGSYVTGNSLCEASDMSGNVWEITSGVALGVTVVSGAVAAVAAVIGAVLAVSSAEAVAVLILVATGLVATVASVAVLAVLAVATSSVAAGGVLRGGAWNSPFDEASCFSRKAATYTKFTGFRCVKR